MTLESTSSEKFGVVRLGWPLEGAALVAMAAHFFTTDGFLGLPICGLLLFISQMKMLDWRLSRSRMVRYSLRAIVATVITILIGFPDAPFQQWYMRPEYTKLIGCLIAAEIAVRAWEKQDLNALSKSRGIMLVLTACLLATASNTDSRTNHHIQWLAPIYALLIVLALRSFARPHQLRRPLVALRAFAIVLAVAWGFVMVQAVTTYDQKLTSWAVELLNRNRKNGRNEIGLTGSPRLGTVSNPEPSMERVLLIDGPRGERYLRAIAFDTLEHQQWKAALRDRSFASVDVKSLRTDQPGQRFVFTRIGETLDLLPLPPNTALLDTPRGLEEDDLAALRDQESGLTGASSRYEAIVPTSEHFQGPLCRAIDEAQRAKCLSLPKQLDTRVIELAKTVAGNGEPMIRLARLVQHLRANHKYSLSYKPEGDDALSDFILHNRSAHCQYFGSALVVMARAAGVPARFVTGYYAHESYGSDQTVVRQRDAHAWAECWVDGVGWITLDATPAGGLPDHLFDDASSLRRMWERVTDIPGMIRDALARFSRRTMVIVIIAVSVFTLGFWILRAVMRSRRRKRRTNPADYHVTRPDLLMLTRRFERLLRRRGMPCAANQTWRTHLAVVANHPARTLYAEFMDLYDRARFGGPGFAQLPRLHEVLDQLETHTGGIANG